MHPLIPIILIAALVTLGILLAGVVNMARSGNPRRANWLMRARVIAQFVTLGLILLFLLTLAGD